MRRMDTSPPIVWEEWSGRAFAEAQAKDKPLFVYLYAHWCRWCRKEDENLAAPGVARLANQYFVSIRVNTDERPDIYLRYNMGGWPSLAVLTPDGEVIAGSTFLSKANLKKFLMNCYLLFQNQREEIQRRLQAMKERPKSHPGARGEEMAISSHIVTQTLEFLKTDFDPIYGGFGREPKFPHYEALELALLAYHLYRNPTVKEIFTLTLNRMSEGEIFDREEGGFFRYAQKQDWSEPQYEKILVDNAWLLQNYLNAYLLTNQERYLQVAHRTLDYIHSHLYQEDQGVFYSSQWADDQYYRLARQDRRFSPPPPYEEKIYTDGSALAASASVKAGLVLNEGIYGDRARKVLDFLWRHCLSGDFGLVHLADQPPSTPWRLLGDQVHMARACLDFYQFSGEELYLSRASFLADLLYAHFYDVSEGGFWDRVGLERPIGRLKERMKPILENALAAEFFFKLGTIHQKPEYITAARRVLNFFSRNFPRYGIFASRYAFACQLLLQPPLLIVIVGKYGDSATQGFVKQVFKTYDPRKIIRIMYVEEHPEMAHVLDQYGHKPPRGYLYRGQSCQLETSDAWYLVQKIEELAS